MSKDFDPEPLDCQWQPDEFTPAFFDSARFEDTTAPLWTVAGFTFEEDREHTNRSDWTKRKKDVIEFGFNDSGNTVFFAVHIENESKKGPCSQCCNPRSGLRGGR